MTLIILQTLLHLNHPPFYCAMLKFLNNLTLSVACQTCKRKITESSHQKYIKRRNCGVWQHQNEWERDASVQVKVEIGGKETLLVAFKDAIESLLPVSLDVSVMSNSESIEDLLIWT